MSMLVKLLLNLVLIAVAAFGLGATIGALLDK